MLSQSDATTYLSTLRERIDLELAGLIDRSEPERLYESVQYALKGRGKRFRPLLTLLAADIFDSGVEKALSVAVSMEVFHTFSLVHDDIMDHSDIRRGRETIHRKWDEPTAILCGDFLAGLSTRLLLSGDHGRLPDMLLLHYQTLQLLCEGQVLDMTFEERRDVSVEDYLTMIDKKTAALLMCCLEMGGLIGHADEAGRSILKEIGWHIGRAFQIQDDLLDLTATTEKWGKPVGGDLVSGKKTYLSLKALESVNGAEKDYFYDVLEQSELSQAKIMEVRERMRSLGVLEEAETTVIFHSEKALESVLSFPEGKSRDALAHMIRAMQNRLH